MAETSILLGDHTLKNARYIVACYVGIGMHVELLMVRNMEDAVVTACEAVI